MSAEDEEERPLIQMVTAPYRSRADEEMTLVGLVYGAVLLLFLLPLLPFLAIVWALGVILESTRPEPEA